MSSICRISRSDSFWKLANEVHELPTGVCTGRRSSGPPRAKPDAVLSIIQNNSLSVISWVAASRMSAPSKEPGPFR